MSLRWTGSFPSTLLRARCEVYRSDKGPRAPRLRCRCCEKNVEGDDLGCISNQVGTCALAVRRHSACFAAPSTATARLLCGVRDRATRPCYALATRCPVLT
eukprot:2360126-Rhodomonas_salina.1